MGTHLPGKSLLKGEVQACVYSPEDPFPYRACLLQGDVSAWLAACLLRFTNYL